MYIMNLIHDICLTINDINNTPKWKFITKHKQIKKLNENRLNFLDLNIFSSSDNVLTFLLAINDYNPESIPGLAFNKAWLHIDIIDDNIHIDYYPNSNRFEIWGSTVAYTIYRNTKNSNKINNMWEPLSCKMKKRYLEIIIQMAEYISQPLNK